MFDLGLFVLKIKNSAVEFLLILKQIEEVKLFLMKKIKSTINIIN